MVILTISVSTRSNKRNELLSACRSIADQTRPEKGCLGCRLSQDIDNENLINLEETWLGRTYEIRINGGTQEEGRAAVKRARGSLISV